MDKSADVLERTVLHPGKYFMKAGEENMRAFIVQNGEVTSYYTNDEGKKIEIEKYGPGAIFGEKGLVVNYIPTFDYEATQTTTVIVITRQDFEKHMKKVPKAVKTVLDHTLKKIQSYERKGSQSIINEFDIDDIAIQLVNDLIQGLPDDKKEKYQATITPHVNALIKAIKDIKQS
ncbi:MAG: cyclic nucleotide-binding domain-containing protein [Alphaproteobacteria bacterium]|nr:cyclic nucleotide-binding domain-containing protein [Alphaproteobacteria bacterium]